MLVNNKWGINRQAFKQLCRFHGKTVLPPHKLDGPAACMLGADYWHTYPIRDYDYTYNAWGWRGQDYQQYEGQLINICIGDSNTVNLGGPVEHSWPFLLSKYFDIPTLNFGLDGACFYDFNPILERARQSFKINKIFVLYNLFDQDQEPVNHSVLAVPNSSKIDTKINILKNHCWVQGAHWQFDPAWSFFKDELKCLYEHFPDAHDYMSGVDLDWKAIDYDSAVTSKVLAEEYQKIAGGDWIDYSKFIELLIVDPKLLLNQYQDQQDQRLILEYLDVHVAKLLLTNRDGWHMSRQLNQSLADYFYQQATKKY